MSSLFKILLVFILITNCTTNKNKKYFWSKNKIIEEKKSNIKEIFKKELELDDEFNPNLKIKLKSKAINKNTQYIYSI